MSSKDRHNSTRRPCVADEWSSYDWMCLIGAGESSIPGRPQSSAEIIRASSGHYTHDFDEHFVRKLLRHGASPTISVTTDVVFGPGTCVASRLLRIVQDLRSIPQACLDSGRMTSLRLARFIELPLWNIGNIRQHILRTPPEVFETTTKFWRGAYLRSDVHCVGRQQFRGEYIMTEYRRGGIS